MLSKTKWRLPRRLARFSPPRGDPSRTTTIVNRYSRDLDRRWRELDQVLKQMIVKDDVLGLSDTPPRVILQIQPAGRFSFPTDPAGKARAFDRWLRGAMDRGVLEIVGGSPTGWQNKYIRASYSVGVNHADKALAAIVPDVVRKAFGFGVPEAGALAQTLNAPIHVEKLQLLFSRNFSELRGITDAQGQNLSRIVTEGLATGQSPREVSRRITRSIRTIGRNRSLTLARTETIRSHSQATLTRYAQSGITTVQGFAEFLTAGDDRVCIQCQGLEGRRFTLQEAGSIIPVHPNCRCVWLPVISAKAPTTTPIPSPADPFAGFISGDVAKTHLNRRYVDRLPTLEASAMREYQDGLYSKWNGALRRPIRSDGTPARLDSNDRFGMSQLDNSLRAQVPIGKDTQVWRGAGSGRNVPADLAVGDVIVDAGYVSTTTNAEIAWDFSTARDHVTTVYKIGLPKDARGVWMEAAIGDDIEDEFLLAAGSRFRVVKIEKVEADVWTARTENVSRGGFLEGQEVREISVMLEP